MKQLPTPRLFALCLLFCLIIAFVSCSKSNSASTPSDTTVITDAALSSELTDTSIYIDITVNNQRTLRVETYATGPKYWGESWGGIIVDSNLYPYNLLGCTFVPTEAADKQVFAFSKGSQPYYGNADVFPTDFINHFFAAGNYPYAVKTNDTTVQVLGDSLTVLAFPLTKIKLSSGVHFLWIDSAGTTWETSKGSADQTGSYFTITGSVPGPAHGSLNNPYRTLVSASFDCILYDDNGHSMHVTNGKFRQPIYL